MIKNVGNHFVAFVIMASVLLFGITAQQVQGRGRCGFKSISVEEAAQLIEENEDNPDFVILDVRTSSEFQSGHIENAVNIDYYSDTFQEEMSKLDKGKHYLIYCNSGSRSSRSLKLVRSLGFSEVCDMRGGISTWMAKGYPVVK